MRYVLWITDRVCGAARLLTEMVLLADRPSDAAWGHHSAADERDRRSAGDLFFFAEPRGCKGWEASL